MASARIHSGWCRDWPHISSKAGARCYVVKCAASNPGPNGPRALLTDDGTLPVDQLVIAAGAFSAPLTHALGHRVPLESHRGYHVTLTDPGEVPRRVVFPVDYSFAISPMVMGLPVRGDGRNRRTRGTHQTTRAPRRC